MEQLLKNAIIKNPDLPIRFFIGEGCNQGDYSYEENSISKVSIDSLTLYNDKYMDEDEFADEIYNNLYDEFKSENELNKHIDGIIGSRQFVKTICVFLG